MTWQRTCAGLGRRIVCGHGRDGGANEMSIFVRNLRRDLDYAIAHAWMPRMF